MADEVIHSIIDISVNPNRTTAFLSFSRPENGGMDVNLDRVMRAIHDKNISYGILEDEIKEAVEQRKYDENICAARWDAPEDGIDGKITYYYKTDQCIAPVENEHGVVDYKNLGLVRNITKGTPIAEISLPTEGKPGRDIMGMVVRQKLGIPVNVKLGNGTSLINDGKQIVAAVDGNLVFKSGSFCVDETLVVNGDVDVSTGNIDFIGSVTIKGSVFEGFRVTSKKDISILGSVNGSELAADGNITVKIGIINSRVNCMGNVKIGFCENSRVHCDGNVESASFVGGEVFAGGDLIASGKGVIMGGKYTALNNVEASVIGSDKYVKTEITLGNNAVLMEERETLDKMIKEMDDKADQLGKILNTLAEIAKAGKLSPEKEQMKVEAVRSRLKIQSEIKKSKLRISEIDEALELTQNLSVSIKRMIYPGVLLRINSCTLAVKSVENRCRATVDKGDITFKPL